MPCYNDIKQEKQRNTLFCGRDSRRFSDGGRMPPVKGAGSMKLVCDRIEGNLAVLSDDSGNIASVPLSWFAEPAGEGDAVSLTLVRDAEETVRRQDSINSLFRKLKEKGSKDS